MSAAGRAAIVKTAKKRWAKVRAVDSEKNDVKNFKEHDGMLIH
jgi:hypothetical protein